MAYADWKILAKRLVSCSCDYGCPCEFMGRPTHGHCEGVEAAEIVRGHYEDVSLDGLRFAAVYRWPGAVHEGGGTLLGIFDARADEAQWAALFKILGGEEQEPTTLFNIYGATIETELDPVFADIEFDWDIAARVGRMAVRDVFEAELTPIRNPVTGAAHRAIIRLPEGFEFRDAEMASSRIRSQVPGLEHAYDGSYGFLTYATYGPYGIVEKESFPDGSLEPAHRPPSG